MSLLPHDASFHERVADLFAAFRGRGVALSALDVELVDTWARTGAPFEVVARGIRKAAEGALFDAAEDDRGLRSLTACIRSVEVEIEKYTASSVGRPEAEQPGRAQPPLHLKRHTQLKKALTKLARSDTRLFVIADRLKAGLPKPNDFDEAQHHEDLVCAVLLHALPFAERLPLLQEARDLVQKSPAMSARARRESRRLHRSALLRRAIDLPAFW
jgi:hypothetical protein